MRCLSFIAAAALCVCVPHSALAVSKKSHHPRAHAAHASGTGAHARVVHTSARLAKHSRKGRRVRLEAKDDSPNIAIPDVPLRQAKLVMLPPLKGSRASLIRQNERSEADGLDRIEDDEALNALRVSRSLVLLPASMSLRVNPDLPENRRYCRSWTAHFLADLSRVHYERFHRPLQVNSAVRTVEYQRRLIEINGNAAPADGDVASPHLTGAAIDIAKKGLSMSEVAWMRAYLLPLQTAGKIDVEEEFYQSCFHITVYKSYEPQPAHRSASTALIAARIR